MNKVTDEKTAGPKTRRPRKTPRPAKKDVMPRKETRTGESLALARRIVKLLKAKKGHNPVIIDVRETSSGVADYFVVVAGNSQPHIRGMCEDVALQLKQSGIACFRRLDNQESGWLVLDYVDVVIHILLEEMRAFYAIEDLWTRSRPTEQDVPPASG